MGTAICNMLFILMQDTRDPQEHAVSHIPGSIQLDYKSEDPWNGLDLSNTKQGNTEHLYN